MGNPALATPFGAAEYLRWEAERPGKHEFVAGEVFAMGSATRRHVTVSLNLAAALDDALADTPYRAYMAGMKVEAAKDAAYFYPDVLVTCDPDRKAVELSRRGEDGLWVLLDIAADTPLEMASIGATAAWERLFRNVD